MRFKHLSVLFALSCAACSGSTQSVTDPDGGAATFSATPLAVYGSDAGIYSIAVYSSPQPPIRGLNTFQYVVTYSDGGAVAADLPVSVVPFMPQMNHGTSIQPTVDAGSPGVYQVDNVFLFMPGEFELETSFGGPAPDFVAPTFSVN